jgi:hypothetical protein
MKAIAVHELHANRRWTPHMTDVLANKQAPLTLPFVCNEEQIKVGTTRAERLAKDGLVPKEVAYMQLPLIFTTPGWLKLHDRLILLGPIFKYLLQGFFQSRERKCLFR